MADQDLQNKILRILNMKPKKIESLSKLVQSLREPRKAVNLQLYKMLRKGLVSKINDSPPVWAVGNSTGNQLSLSNLAEERGLRSRTQRSAGKVYIAGILE